jgi:hypothetical protein
VGHRCSLGEVREEEDHTELTVVKVGRRGSGNGRLTSSNGSGGVSSTIRRLGSEEENLEVGKGVLAIGEGGSPFYRGKRACRRLVKATIRPTTLNGAREWSLDGEGKTVGRGCDRAAAPSHFSMGGEGTGRFGVKVSGGQRMAVLAW